MLECMLIFSKLVDGLPLNYMSPKLIIKMHREGKDCSSGEWTFPAESKA